MIDRKISCFLLAVLCASLLCGRGVDFRRKTNRLNGRNYVDRINTVIVLGKSGRTVNINEFVMRIIENLRSDMTKGISELKVPVLDPFYWKDPVKVDADDVKGTVHGNISNIRVEGLSQFTLEDLYANLEKLSFKLNLTIPSIKVSGNYTLDGRIIKIVPLRGNGTFKVESTNLNFAAKATFKKSYGHLQLSQDFDMDVNFNKLEIYSKNFLDGGRWMEPSLKILNNVSKGLFKMYLPAIKRFLFKEINNNLMKLPKIPITHGSTVSGFLDQILTHVKSEMKANNSDSTKLPDSKVAIKLLGSDSVELHDGWLHGISSLHRTSECELGATQRTISLSAHLGLKNLKISYKVIVMAMNIRAVGTVKAVQFNFKVEQSNWKGSSPLLKELKIIEISSLSIELSGLGILTWGLNIIMKVLSGPVENLVKREMTKQISEFLQSEFNKFTFPV